MELEIKNNSGWQKAVLTVALSACAIPSGFAEVVGKLATPVPLLAQATPGPPASALPGVSAAPVGTVLDSGPSCPAGLPDPILVRLNAGKSTLINLPEPIVRRTLGDPGVVDAKLVSPQIIYLVSGKIGSTNAILQGRSGRCVVLDIVVGVDVDAVQSKIRELLPAETGIRVTSAADSIVLTGTVSDPIAAERAVSIANAYARSSYTPGSDSPPGGAGVGAGGGSSQRVALQNAVAGAAPLVTRVVNLLVVTSGQQVMLEVKIAEVSRSLLDKLGVDFKLSRAAGGWVSQLSSAFTTGTAAGNIGAGRVVNGARDLSNLISIEAEKRDGLVRILAEPNVMAISGQEGSFLAGGKILIPVAQANSTGVLTVSLQEKEFGVGLKFTPTLLGDGRINLRVSPEVSELSKEGVGITANGVGGSSILPLITTRRASTTIQLSDGQSFAIGGLIKSTSTANVKAFPILGEIPVLGALFRSTDYQLDKTELVFIVTPRIVKALPPEFTLPTDLVGNPDRKALMLNGVIDTTPKTPETQSGMTLK